MVCTVLNCGMCQTSSVCMYCDSGYYLSSPSTCSPCVAPCATCITSSTNCLTIGSVTCLAD